MKPERSETTENLHHGFTLTEAELRRIYTILTQQMNIALGSNKFATTFRLKFKNQIAVERSSLDDVLAENNGGPWKIQSLEIELYEDSIQPTQILLAFKKSPTQTITYHIEGNDKNWVFVTKSNIDDRIKNIKQLNTTGEDGALLFFAILVSVAFFFVYLYSIFDPTVKLSIAPTFLVKIIMLFVFTFLSLGITTYLLCFPACNFSWGDQITALAKRNARGRGILGGILLALAVNIIAGIFVYFITSK